MATTLFTSPDQPQTLETTLSLPYTLTTGRAAGLFLANLAGRRILGSRCAACSRVVVPAQDVCARCGGELPEVVQVPTSGTLSSWTRVGEAVVVKVRLAGCDVDMLHRLVGDDADLFPGAPVSAVWAEEPTGSILDLAGFAPATDALDAPVPIGPVEDAAEPIVEMPYRLNLQYRHAYGPYYGRLFDELGSYRRIIGSRCSSCHSVLVPPRGTCDICFAPTDQFEDVADTGVLQAFSVIYLEFVGQTRKPPYVYAEVVLDGTATRLIHTVAGVDIDRAAELLWTGMRVRAVWRDAALAKGTLEDIEYFEPVGLVP